jgi:hypothetical protein
MRFIRCGLLLAVAGCSEDSLFGGGKENGASTDATPAPTTATATAPSSADTGVEIEPQYYSFELQFAVDDLGVLAKGASLLVSLHSSLLLDQPEELTRLCSFDVPVVVEPADDNPEDLSLVGWWRVQLGEAPQAKACAPWGPRDWMIGVGAYDNRLDPALYGAGLDGTELYGLYLQEAALEPVLVLGVAGTLEMFEGQTGLVASAPPLPAGEYTARSLILVSLP